MEADDRSALDLLRASRIAAYSIGALSLVAGIVLLAWPGRTIVVVVRLVGILFVVTGFGEAVEAVTGRGQGSYWGLLLLRGAVNLALGLAMIFWPGVTVTVAVWLLGLDLMITGVLGLIAATQVPKEMGRWTLVLRGLVGLVLGLVLVVWPHVSAGVLAGGLAILVGIGLLVFGVVMLVSGYQLTKARVTEIR